MKTNTPREVTVNTEQGLYVIPCGDGYSCLGFNVADRWAKQVAAWLTGAEADGVALTATPGTIEHYQQYRAIMDAGAAHSKRTGKRCEAQLIPQLKGLEGKRVEVILPSGEKSRFYVGKSTGWLPIHLEIKSRNSDGGGAVYFPEGATVRVVGGSR